MESGSEFGNGRKEQQNNYVTAEDFVVLPEKQNVAEDRLLTPEGLQTLLLVQFETYCNMKKPESLKDKAEAPVLGSPGQVLDEFKQDKKATANKILDAVGSFFKKTAAVAYEHTRTHTATTEFVANEMADIMRQSCSALKKMTDLTILFHGLHRYISTRNSVDFRQLLDEALETLWVGTPQQGQEVSKNNIKFLYKDRIMFEARFEEQIVIAQKLIAANNTLVERALYEKAMREGSVPLMAGSKYKPQDWQYRCEADVEFVNANYRPAPTAWMGDTYNAHLTKLEVSHYIPPGEAAELRPLSKPAPVVAPASSGSLVRDDFYDTASNYEPAPLYISPAGGDNPFERSGSPPEYDVSLRAPYAPAAFAAAVPAQDNHRRSRQFNAPVSVQRYPNSNNGAPVYASPPSPPHQAGIGGNNNNAPQAPTVTVEVDAEGWQVFPMGDEQAVDITRPAAFPSAPSSPPSARRPLAPRPSAPPAPNSGSSSLANSSGFLRTDKQDQEKADFEYALALSQSATVFNGAQARPVQGVVAEPVVDMNDRLADDLFGSLFK